MMPLIVYRENASDIDLCNNMTNEFRYMMHVAGHAARRLPVEDADSQNLDWEKLFQLAREQAVPFLLTYVLRRRKDLGCPEELRREWSAQMFATLLETNEKKENVLTLLQEMEEAGFRPILLKGYVAADCYAVADCRISSDVDILIPANQEARVCAFLKKKGFNVLPRWTDGHHSICTHPDYGYLEIHAELFDRLVADVWFRDVKSHVFDLRDCVRIETVGGSYRTLGYTDNLLFMTLHMVKHFINGGICLRMMLDIGTFIARYGDSIDFQKYWDVLQSLSYDEMVGCVLWALVRYCGFDASEFPGIPEENVEQLEALLSDMEQGGWLGKNNMDEGRESHLVYSAYMRRKGADNYHLSLLKQRSGNVIRRVFPARVVLMKYTSKAVENAWMIPIAWCRHVAHGMGVVFGKKPDRNGVDKANREEQKILRDRAALLKQLHIM